MDRIDHLCYGHWISTADIDPEDPRSRGRREKDRSIGSPATSPTLRCVADCRHRASCHRHGFQLPIRKESDGGIVGRPEGKDRACGSSNPRRLSAVQRTQPEFVGGDKDERAPIGRHRNMAFNCPTIAAHPGTCGWRDGDAQHMWWIGRWFRSNLKDDPQHADHPRNRGNFPSQSRTPSTCIPRPVQSLAISLGDSILSVVLASWCRSMDQKQIIASIFGVRRALIGMIHVQALPGTPESNLPVEEICDKAVRSAEQLRDAGFHGLMIENMHDRPYLKRQVGPEIIAAMAVVGKEIRRAASLPLGLQILGGANREALAAALACDADFIRAEAFVYSHVADEGLMESDAGELLRYRKSIGAEQVRIFADIKKKHAAHAITADTDLVETAHAAEFFLADGVIVTGTATGRPADPAEVETISKSVHIPTLVGSGITPENLAEFWSADAFIVGSVLKQQGIWSNPPDPSRIRAMIQAFDSMP